MDIKQYQIDRQQDLEAFKAQYGDLKTQYLTYLSQAVQDPEKIQAVLDTNKSLVALVNEFIAESQNKFDAATIQDLTDEILTYQKEYQEIQESTQKAKTAQNILNADTQKLQSMQYQFNIYLLVLGIGILFVIYLIFRVPSTTLPQLSAPLLGAT
jgi:uncharacterized membrane protein YccC